MCRDAFGCNENIDFDILIWLLSITFEEEWLRILFIFTYSYEIGTAGAEAYLVDPQRDVFCFSELVNRRIRRNFQLRDVSTPHIKEKEILMSKEYF